MLSKIFTATESKVKVKKWIIMELSMEIIMYILNWSFHIVDSHCEDLIFLEAILYF